MLRLICALISSPCLTAFRLRLIQTHLHPPHGGSSRLASSAFDLNPVCSRYHVFISVFSCVLYSYLSSFSPSSFHSCLLDLLPSLSVTHLLLLLPTFLQYPPVLPLFIISFITFLLALSPSFLPHSTSFPLSIFLPYFLQSFLKTAFPSFIPFLSLLPSSLCLLSFPLSLCPFLSGGV